MWCYPPAQKGNNKTPLNKQETMKKLLKTYGLNSDMQYFELIVASLLCGQRKQAINQFLSMDKAYRVTFIKNALTNWNSGLSNSEISIFVEFIYFSKPQQ